MIIGGVAARLHDTGHATIDIDICPSKDEANLDSLPFDPHPDTLRQVEMMTLITEHGPLDLCFAPAGFPEGYASLSEHASVIVIGAVDLPVASLEDVVASKRAAGRPKDIVALPPLEARLRRR